MLKHLAFAVALLLAATVVWVIIDIMNTPTMHCYQPRDRNNACPQWSWGVK